MNQLNIDEELNIRKNLREPHLSYISSIVENRKKVAYLVLQKKEDEILLVDRSGFLIDSVFAGLTEKHIEYIAKKAPKEYKIRILQILSDKQMMNGVFEVVRSMDGDLGHNITKNEDRIRNVIQYIKDNIQVFQF